MTRKSIAAVVATKASDADHVTPLAIVSLEACLRNAASAAAEVNKEVSFAVAVACSAAVITAEGFYLATVISALSI